MSKCWRCPWPVSAHARLALLAAIIFATATFVFAAMRCANFYCSMIDLGSFYQVVDAMYHGGAPLTTLQPPYIARHWLGVHFSPIIFLSLPFYALWPSPLALQLVQSALIASTVWPIYLASKALGLNARSALIMALIFLINPFTISGAIWDFHEVAFAVPLFGWLMFALISKRFGLFLLCCFGLLCTKEHYGLAVAGAGLLWALHHKEKVKGLNVALLGLAALATTITVIMPYFADGGAAAALDSSGVGDKRYSWLAASLSEPTLFFSTIADIWPQWLIYGAALFLPFLFLPLFAFTWLLPLAADMAANVLSLAGLLRSFLSYHNMAVVPVLVIVLAKVVAERRLHHSKMLYLMPLIFFGYYMGHPHGPSYWQPSNVSVELGKEDAAVVENISAYINNRPDMRVAAQNNIGVLLGIPASRLSYFPHSGPAPDIIVARPTFPFDHSDSIGSAYNMAPLDYLEELEKYIISGRYNIAIHDRGWMVIAAKPVSAISDVRQTSPDELDALLADLKKQREMITEIYARPAPSRLFF